MTREHRQAYMEGFGRAMLLEDYEEDDFGASRPSRYIPSERNALWWGRRGMEPPWESGFGDDVVPHLCETQWAESDARCIQHLGDPTFGDWED